VIDSYWHSLDTYWLNESDDIFEKFLIDTNDEIDFTDTCFLSELIEFHSAITESWIIVRITDFEFDRFSWIIERTKSIDSLWRWTITTEVPIKRINVIELKTRHLSRIEFYNKRCSWKSTSSTQFITILIEEKNTC